MSDHNTKWLSIKHKGKSKSGKTDIYHVYTIDNVNFLGWITWYAPWRRYCFFPDNETAFEQICLRDIASFIEAVTEAHKKVQDNE